MSHFAIAGLQLASSKGNNTQQIAAEITLCKQRFPWLNMLVLGELNSHGPEKKYAETMPGPTESFYRDLAKQLNIWLIPGSLYEIANHHIYNTTPVIDPQGQVICRYRKIFPFCPYESDVSQGQDIVVFDVPQGRIGIAICYDLWFPEVARSMACKGAEVLIYPTMTGTIDRGIELNLARATAASNQCYVVAINTAGELGNGQSIIVGPQGNDIYVAGEQQEIIPVEIDFAQVRRDRKRGLHNLGQPLKSFRESQWQKSVSSSTNDNEFLASLGELKIPERDDNE
ncbi:carbon-nitrogen hydrolase family protein [Aliiglaciecola sp. 3_MG-2023]|uniref:carbon-nitrogen hydrolase family protein n=1 Tax=Aliiglaciecola sp. 3_MG-2023 TaxID=3062644 RepID=UPI0026E1C977|nr:carbon-nitrogen hydrolase family protein [Aliiglaciecola sp. 3_MG-2023]MDO6694185.1 carbon-nitrogen hydrolase family protein [Aliiglaciecola sp. 3_MG-2023]